MPTKKIDPKRERIIIEIEETGQASSNPLRAIQDTSTLGMLPGYTPPLLRRYRKRKRPIVKGWRFWDLGVAIIEGIETDNLFFADTGYVFDGGGVFNRLEIPDTALVAKAASFTEGYGSPGFIENLRDSYKQILKEESDFYRLVFRVNNGATFPISSTSSLWVDEESFLPTNLSGYNSLRLFSQDPFTNLIRFRTGADLLSGVKTTLLPSYAADEVEFILSDRADIFFTPAYNDWSFGFTQTQMLNYLGGGFDRYQLLFTDYVTFPRIALAPYVPFLQSLTSFLFFRGGSLNPAWSNQSYETFYNLARWFAEAEGSLVVLQNYTPSSSTFSIGNPANFPDSNYFPAPPALPNNANSIGQIGGGEVTKSGELLLIIYQDNQSFFVWVR